MRRAWRRHSERPRSLGTSGLGALERVMQIAAPPERQEKAIACTDLAP